MNTYNIYLGRNIPTGQYVNDALFDYFLDKVDAVVDGYTLTAADGMWKGEPEDTIIMTVATNDYDTALCIAQTYKEMFNQESVAILPLQQMEFI